MQNATQEEKMSTAAAVVAAARREQRRQEKKRIVQFALDLHPKHVYHHRRQNK